MKLRLFVMLSLAALLIPEVASAIPPRPGPYVSGFAGVAIPTTTTSSSEISGFNDRVEFNPGVNIGGTGGFDFGFMRFEGEVSYKHGEIDTVTERNPPGRSTSDVDGRIGAVAMMANLFFDLRNPGPLTPYFGGGVGFAALHQSDTFGSFGKLYASDDDAVFAYQVGGGMEIALNRMLSLDIGYRYFETSKATFNANTDFENRLKFRTHNVAAGVRVKF